MASQQQVGIYLGILEDIKRRLVLVASKPRSTIRLGSDLLDFEVVALNIRKILELIAFASLSANKESYSLVHSDFASHWNAKRLLNKLEAIHPDFYPKPVRQEVLDSGPPRRIHFHESTDDFLTRTQFVELYDLCSQIIHTRNPFSPSIHVDFQRSPWIWANRIEALLRLHLIRLAGAPEVWVVQLAAPADGHAHAYIANPLTSTS